MTVETKGFCTLKKIPLFLFSVRTPSAGPDFEYILGGIGRRDESEDQKELPSPPMQRSVKVNIGIRLPVLINMLDFQILSLGYQYRIIGMKLKDYRGMAFLPLNKEGGRGFVVILNCRGVLFVLTSGAEMKWKRLDHVPKEEACSDLVTFRGRFYASFYSRRTVVVDPYFLEVTTLLMPSPHQGLFNHLVPCGDDELFLVERNFSQSRLIVSRLDEEAGEWFVVTDLGDRVFFINELPLGNVCCLAKELPDGCGVSGNSILFTNQISNVTYSYKYGVREQDGLKCWSFSRYKRVTLLSRYPTVAFRVEHVSP